MDVSSRIEGVDGVRETGVSQEEHAPVHALSLGRLKWVTIMVAIVYLLVVQGIAMGVVMPRFGRPLGHAVSITAYSAGVLVFATMVFGVIGRMQLRIVRQNEELAAANVMAGNLYEDVTRRQRRTQVLYDIAVDITAMRDAHEVLWPIAERTREMLGVDAVSIALFDEAGDGRTLAAWSVEPLAFRSPHAAGTWFPSSALQGQGAKSTSRSDCCPIGDPSLTQRSTPLCIASERIGELSVASAKARAFNDDDLDLMSGLADLAAIAVQKSRLLQGERLIAVLEERQRLAREMHDSLAQVLGYLHLRSQTALRKLDVSDVAGAEEQLQEMANIASEAYADVREAILGLREDVRAKGSFVDSLQEYLEKFSRQAGVTVRLEASEEWAISLDSEAEVQLLRVIQEALTNVRKHARADEAHVSIGRQGREAAIVVKDNGRGFDTKLLGEPDGATFGLRTMRERVERAGGRFIVDSALNEGTSVRIFFPLNGGRHD